MTKSRCKSKCAEGYVCGSFAFNLYKEGIDQGDLCDVHYWKAKALNDATHLAAPVQEPVAWIDRLPEGTTHIARCRVTVNSGGSLSLRTNAFKYDDGVLKVYTTDNDNEYPGWKDAKRVFYHLNFPIIALHTALPGAPQELAERTKEKNT